MSKRDHKKAERLAKKLWLKRQKRLSKLPVFGKGSYVKERFDPREFVQKIIAKFRQKDQEIKAPVFAAPPAIEVTPKLRSALRRLTPKTPGTVCTFEELITALDEQQPQITLADDIMVTKNLQLHYDVVINLNGYSLVGPKSLNNLHILDIRRGNVHLTGEGKIFALGEESVAVRMTGAVNDGVPNYTTLNVDAGVTMYVPESAGILVMSTLSSAYGVELNFAGKIYARDGIWVHQTVQGRGTYTPLIRVKDGAEIMADDDLGAALRADGLGRWRIGSAKCLGAHGVRANFGKFEFQYTQISGAVEAIYLGAEGATELSIYGGTFVGRSNCALAGIVNDENQIKIYGGELWGAEAAVDPYLQPKVKCLGGSFHQGVRELDKTVATISTWSETSDNLVHAQTDKDEEHHLREMLQNAINDLRELDPEDYVGGYIELVRAMEKAEHALNNQASLPRIREVSKNLLDAMANLESADREDLTDEELDKLFAAATL